MNLNTTYLGLKLANPIIIGASPMIYKIDSALALEEAGASAIVMHSLYEEQILKSKSGAAPANLSGHNDRFAESTGFPLTPDRYLKHLRLLRRELKVPVIGSLNGSHPGNWIDFARRIEGAGADAIELNLDFASAAQTQPGHEIEQTAFRIVQKVRDLISIPIAVKISPFYTSLAHFIQGLQEAGADAVVLFNAFIQTDIDLDSITYTADLGRMEPPSLVLRTRWIASLHGRVSVGLCLSGGVQTSADMIKGILAGADTIQIVTAPLRHGPSRISTLLIEIGDWMKKRNFGSVEEMRGILSFQRSRDVESVSRAGYLRMLQSWDEQD